MLSIVAAHDAGSLHPLIRVTGWVFTTVVALGATWRGRSTKWEPAEEDLTGAPAKVSGLVCAAILALIWGTQASPEHSHTLAVITISCVAVCVIAMIGYGLLIGTHVYDKEVSELPNTTTHRKIVAGLWLRPAAKKKREDENLTIQTMLEKAAFDEDELWTRLSRTLAKTLFAVAYIVFTVCGTLAVAGIGMFLLVKHIG
jgi:hypothetical protein